MTKRQSFRACAAVHAAAQIRIPHSSGRSGGFGMNGIIYLIGLIVVVLAILSFLGLR
jgi:hypothetical protein